MKIFNYFQLLFLLIFTTANLDAASADSFTFTLNANSPETQTGSVKDTDDFSDIYEINLAADGNVTVVLSNHTTVRFNYDFTAHPPKAIPGEESYTFTNLTTSDKIYLRVYNDTNAAAAYTLTATLTSSGTGTNSAPVAVNKSFATDVNTSITENMLLGDTDPDGDDLNVTVYSAPANGTLSGINLETGAFTYTPNNDFAGSDAFNYTISDGLLEDNATVTIVVGGCLSNLTNVSLSNTNTTYEDSRDTSVNDNYYVTIGDPGTLIIEVASDGNKVLFNDIDSACTTLGSGKTSERIKFEASSEIYIEVYNGSNSASEHYDLTLTFIPEAGVTTSMDLCYSTVTNTGTNCAAYGGIYAGDDCITTTTIESNSSYSLDLYDVVIYKAYDSSVTYDDCGVDGNSGGGACQTTGITDPNFDKFDAYENAIHYNLGDMSFGTNHTIYDSNTTGNISSIVYIADYNRNSNHYTKKLYPCSGLASGDTGDLVDFFSGVDAVDPISYSSYPYSDADGSAAITTKLSNGMHQMRAVYLGADDIHRQTGITEQNYDALAGITSPLAITFFLSDSSCSTKEPLYVDPDDTTHVLIANIADGTSYADTPVFRLPASAKRNARIRMGFVDWSIMLGNLQNADDCTGSSSFSGNFNGVPSCLNQLGSWTPASTNPAVVVELVAEYPNTANCIDNGTGGVYDAACDSNAYDASGTKGNIFPEKYNNDYGCLMCILDSVGNPDACSRDNFAIRPEKFFIPFTDKSTFPTHPYYRAGQDYNETFYALDALDTQTYNYDENETDSFDVNLTILDSTKLCEDQNVTISPNVNFIDGEANNSYSFSNVGEFNLSIQEIPGQEFAIVDTDDTNDSDRYIEPDWLEVKVIPHHFAINGYLRNVNNKNFTYLSNFEEFTTSTDQNMSAALDLNITAEAENNDTTSNYTDNCYAQNATLDINLTTPINITPPYPPTAGLTKILIYDVKLDQNRSIPLIGSPSNFVIDLNATSWLSDGTEINGTNRINYKINFDRHRNKAVNPIRIEINDINMTDDDNATNFDANLTENNATFYYGRLHAPRYRIEGADGKVTLYYEVYCYGTGCNQTWRSEIADKLSVDGIRWYQNDDHTPLEGNVLSDSVPKSSHLTGDFINLGTERVTGNQTDARFTYKILEKKGFPYKATIEVNASNWLIYHRYDANAKRNSFELEFHDTGHEIGKGTGRMAVDTNISINVNRRIEW